MKILHSAIRDLSDREFDTLSDKISNSLYDLDSEIREIYKIHIDFIDNVWYVEFVPKDNRTPVIKVNTYTTYDADNRELLRFTPADIIKFPEHIKLDNYDDALNISNKISTIFNFLIELYDFEFQL